MSNVTKQLLKLIIKKTRSWYRFRRYPNDSWYWPVLKEYHDPKGRTLEEAEFAWMSISPLLPSEKERQEAVRTRRWISSPKNERSILFLIGLIESFFHPDEAFTYLEFGTCFGTTLAYILSHFKKAQGIGVEVNEPRFDVTRWLIHRMNEEWNLRNRVDLYMASIIDVPLKPNSVDVMLMDTGHIYPDDFEFIMHLTTNGVLRQGFLFVVDDPTHTGTDTSRKRFVSEQSARYKIITRVDKNLWWFFEK